MFGNLIAIPLVDRLPNHNDVTDHDDGFDEDVDGGEEADLHLLTGWAGNSHWFSAPFYS